MKLFVRKASVAPQDGSPYNAHVHPIGSFERLRRQGRRPSLALRTALSGLFGALAFLLGHLLAGLPNFELASLILFLAGVLGGWQVGIFSALVATFLHNALNPFGPAAPPLLLAQALGFSLFGLVGGHLFDEGRRIPRWCIPLVGATLTLFFDGITNLAMLPLLDLPLSVIFATGLPFMAAHVLGNGVSFGLATVFLGLGWADESVEVEESSTEAWKADPQV